VHRVLTHIRSWMSSLAARRRWATSTATSNPDDLCYVDTRQDAAIVAPMMGDRYAPFRLIAPGIDATMAPMGCLIGDLNEDGLPDLVVYYWGRTPAAFLRIDNGPGTLDTPPSAAATSRWNWWPATCAGSPARRCLPTSTATATSTY